MSDISTLALALLAGMFLGAFFFGGLWWTAQKGVTSDWPAVWFLSSLLLRNCLILAGFYLVAQGHWSRLVACLLGFLIARVIVVKHLTQPSVDEASPTVPATHLGIESLTYDPAEAPTPLEQEAHHAPYSR